MLLFVTSLSVVGCDAPNAGQERFATDDGRTAIGVAQRIVSPAGGAVVSEVVRGERRYLPVCGSPDTIALATNPRQLPPTNDSMIERASCSPMLVLVWDVVGLDQTADAVRIEILDNGKLGWIRSDVLGYAVDPGECQALYVNDPAREDRCRIGPPLWPNPDSATS